MRTVAVVATVALLAFAFPSFAQQPTSPFQQCGTVQLIFMNPDLQLQDDGLVHASGTFFIQFQAIGDQAAQVARITFSFGKALPDNVLQCESPAGPLTGAYLQGYRSDSTPADGFFVPINTTLVPDDQYGAAIDAYDSSGALLAHGYTKAVVENGGTPCFTDGRCTDHTKPWPIILPGDGEQTNEVGGITIEFAEFVADVFVRVNGEPVVPESWVPKPRDDDAQPGNDEADCGATAPVTDNLPIAGNILCHRTIWGTGFHIARDALPGDVVEVRALDLAGNEAFKVVTIGGATQGGAIELKEPELTLTAEALDLEADAGAPAEYKIKLVNVGKGEAEARMTVQAPGNLTTEWSSPTVNVAAGGEQIVTLKAAPTKDLKPGSYTLLARATYKSGTDDVQKQLALHLTVQESRAVPESPLRQTRVNQTDLPASGDEAPKATPGLEALAGVGAVALVALAGRRRRA